MHRYTDCHTYKRHQRTLPVKGPQLKLEFATPLCDLWLLAICGCSSSPDAARLCDSYYLFVGHLNCAPVSIFWVRSCCLGCTRLPESSHVRPVVKSSLQTTCPLSTAHVAASGTLLARGRPDLQVCGKHAGVNIRFEASRYSPRQVRQLHVSVHMQAQLIVLNGTVACIIGVRTYRNHGSCDG